LARFISPDTIVPSPGDPQALNRYSYSANNPLRYNDPSGHDWVDAVNFLLGFGAQWASANAWMLPQAQEALSVQPNESLPMTVGRHLGNVAAIMQGVAEVGVGAGVDVGGGGLCLTGVGCLVGAPALVAGTAVAAHGVTVAAAGAAMEGQMLGNMLLAQRTAHAEDRAMQGRPIGSAWNDAQKSTRSKVFLDTETGNYVVQGDKSRIHIFTQEEGVLKTHTSFRNPLRNTADRLRLGKWRPLTDDKYDIWLRLRDQAQ
jgi:hypothetical protein